MNGRTKLAYAIIESADPEWTYVNSENFTHSLRPHRLFVSVATAGGQARLLVSARVFARAGQLIATLFLRATC